MPILHDLPATNLPSEPLATGKFRHVRVNQGQYGSISCLFAHQVGRQSQTLVLDEAPPNLDRIDFLTCSVMTICVSIKTSQQSNCKRTLIEVEFKPWWLNMLESLMNQPKLSSRKTWISYIISLFPYILMNQLNTHLSSKITTPEASQRSRVFLILEDQSCYWEAFLVGAVLEGATVECFSWATVQGCLIGILAFKK